MLETTNDIKNKFEFKIKTKIHPKVGRFSSIKNKYVRTLKLQFLSVQIVLYC